MKYRDSVLRYEIGAGAIRKEGKWIKKTTPDNNWDVDVDVDVAVAE